MLTNAAPLSWIIADRWSCDRSEPKLCFQVVFVCVALSGPVSPAELTCETLILLSTNFTGNFLFGISFDVLSETGAPTPSLYSASQQGP